MAEITDVTITAGVPTAGTGTVPTLSKTNTLLGAVDETAPVTDTGSSGISGRLQRIAQRLTALLPASLGAGGGVKIDGSGTALPVSGTVTANAGTGNHAITAASGAIASGAIASGAVASGAFASGAVASGAIASGAIASGAVASGAIVDGAMVTVGAKTDAKATQTDATSISAMSVWKQISASVQALVVTLGTAVLTRGPGAGDSNTLRVTIDTHQATGSEYETYPESATTTMGATGGVGDYLSRVLIVPEDLSPGSVSIKDGSNAAIVVFAGGANSIVTLHSFEVSVEAFSVQGAWQIVSGANVTGIGFGDFT